MLYAIPVLRKDSFFFKLFRLFVRADPEQVGTFVHACVCVCYIAQSSSPIHIATVKRIQNISDPSNAHSGGGAFSPPEPAPCIS